MRECFIIGALLCGFYWWSGREISRPAGVLIAEEPVQREVYRPRIVEKAGYRIGFLASFDIRARVLATERYWFDRGAALAPVDLALGWGAMSNSELLEQLWISQGGRYYRWSAKNSSVSRQVVERHSSNMHMIPASAAIERRLKELRAGNLVRIKGYLVEVTGEDGYRWKSSLTRDDTGGGACELVWVESIEAW